MIPESTTITDRGRRTRRALLWVAGLIVGLNAVVWAANSLTTGGSVSGPSGSSYVTTPGGAAALAGTLERLGTEVSRSRSPLDQAPLTPDATLAVIEVGQADYTAAELTAVERFLSAGGRLVVVGDAAVVARLVPDAPSWRSAGGSTAAPDVSTSLGTVGLSSFGSFDDVAEDEAILTSDDGRVVAMGREVGAGLVVWLADAEPFRNAGIGRGDNGALAVALLGPARPVVFDEYRHGFTDEGGLWQVLPAGWRTALVLGALTALVATVAYGRRFGPPQDERRRLGPSRSLYFAAMAGLMSRSDGVGDATDVIRAEARRLLRGRAGNDDLVPAAHAAGLSPVEIEAVLGAGADQHHLMAVDRALAILNQEQR